MKHSEPCACLECRPLLWKPIERIKREANKKTRQAVAFITTPLKEWTNNITRNA